MPGATYSPQMIEKSDSTSLALTTIAILGQAPSRINQILCLFYEHRTILLFVFQRLSDLCGKGLKSKPSYVENYRPG